MPIHDTFGPPPYVYSFLDNLAQVLKGAPKAEGMKTIAAIIDRNRFSEAVLRDAAATILEEEDRFPSPATIIRHAKRRAPPKPVDEATEGSDQIRLAQEQLEIERQWLARFRMRGDEYHIRVCSKNIAGLEGWLARREGGTNYADVAKIGGTDNEQGLPNREQIAAYTGESQYLTDHGNADPSFWARKLSTDILKKANR